MLIRLIMRGESAAGWTSFLLDFLNLWTKAQSQFCIRPETIMQGQILDWRAEGSRVCLRVRFCFLASSPSASARVFSALFHKPSISHFSVFAFRVLSYPPPHSFSSMVNGVRGITMEHVLFLITNARRWILRCCTRSNRRQQVLCPFFDSSGCCRFGSVHRKSRDF